MDSVKIEESDENASLGRRLRSLRTDQNDGEHKMNRKPSRCFLKTCFFLCRLEKIKYREKYSFIL